MKASFAHIDSEKKKSKCYFYEVWFLITFYLVEKYTTSELSISYKRALSVLFNERHDLILLHLFLQLRLTGLPKQ